MCPRTAAARRATAGRAVAPAPRRASAGEIARLGLLTLRRSPSATSRGRRACGGMSSAATIAWPSSSSTSSTCVLRSSFAFFCSSADLVLPGFQLGVGQPDRLVVLLLDLLFQRRVLDLDLALALFVGFADGGGVGGELRLILPAAPRYFCSIASSTPLGAFARLTSSPAQTPASRPPARPRGAALFRPRRRRIARIRLTSPRNACRCRSRSVAFSSASFAVDWNLSFLRHQVALWCLIQVTAQSLRSPPASARDCTTTLTRNPA